MASGFCFYELRTTDITAAQAFYSTVVGLEMSESSGRFLIHCSGQLVGEMTVLPERAIAQGAPSHWLGHLSTSDVEESLRRWVALGAIQLGPVRQAADGTTVAALRDPCATVVGLSNRPGPSELRGVLWHELHTQDPLRAAELYGELFGWQRTQTLDLGAELGAYLQFSWLSSGQNVGGMLSITGRPGVHPQWLFYFGVDDLDRALLHLTELGGVVAFGPHVVATGTRVAVCEDSQGAAFGMVESAKST